MTDRTAPDEVMQDAVAWVVRVNDAAFGDWEAFTAWLEASPAHADAYHAAASAEAEMVEALADAPRAPVQIEYSDTPTPLRWRWPAWAGAALAASLVGVLIYHVETPAPIIYETAPGVQRTVTFADGSSAMLNGGTRLLADGHDTRSLTLAHGEALFTIRHDEAHPFRVRVGSADVVDVGTRFDVVRDRGATHIAVSEGAIDWRGGGDAVRVAAGHELRARDDTGEVEVGTVSPQAVGGWTQGQLSYDGTALGEVAGDLSRALGVSVTVDPEVAARPVRGVVRIGGSADVVVPRLAAVAGVSARRDGERWRLRASP
jgi:transmembrane sensor